mmetsp:Transcript_30234/g.26687  ORF Transcript_30234/g.26687 Transcript_30234/m.26687 type:complete len:460 (-) Transcript_30234:416-1795(-)
MAFVYLSMIQPSNANQSKSHNFGSVTITSSINNLQVALAPKFNDNYWNCSNCNKNNHPTRNEMVCINCGVMDSDRLRIKANGFYKFGIIQSPKTSLLPKDTPFFIHPLKRPKVSYYMKRHSDGITIRFVVDLVDTKFVTNYTKEVNKLGFIVKSSSNGHHLGWTKVLNEGNMVKPGTFDVFLSSPYDGQYKLDIWAIIEYKMGVPLKKYSKQSPKTELLMNLQKPMSYHEKYMEKYILSQSKFERKQKKIAREKRQEGRSNDDDEKDYDQLTLIELNTDSDNYQTVKYQFLDSSKYKMCDIERLCIYKIQHKHRYDAYRTKKKQILKSLSNNKNKLNELYLYHGTDLESIIKILHQGFLRQFASKTVYGKGSYFARDASYSCSTQYSSPDNDGFQHILLCRVICGEWILGSSSMKLPPTKPNSYTPYETTVNNETKPSVFVTYKDDQAMPMYLISFKSN